MAGGGAAAAPAQRRRLVVGRLRDRPPLGLLRQLLTRLLAPLRQRLGLVARLLVGPCGVLPPIWWLIEAPAVVLRILPS